jgi:hypothetical protein
VITTLAGNGVYAYSGDGAAATDASLFEPMGVAIDSGGHVFIADMINSRIRQVDLATGIITTVDFVTSGATTLRFDTAAHQFVQNWQTPKTSGLCFVARKTTTADGGSLSALFKLK